VETTIALKRAAGDNDVPIWRWLEQVLQHLTVDGMSSEESTSETEIETVYRVKILEWRRDIEKELRIIDQERLLDAEIFAPQGAKPVKRLRGTGNPVSIRPPVQELPRAFYDEGWYSKTTAEYRELTLAVSREQFQWLTILAG
jgi:hypothetical protein